MSYDIVSWADIRVDVSPLTTKVLQDPAVCFPWPMWIDLVDRVNNSEEQIAENQLFKFWKPLLPHSITTLQVLSLSQSVVRLEQNLN